MKNLALQIAVINDVKIHNAELSNPGGRKIHSGRRTQPPSTNTQHPSTLKLSLPVHTDLWHDQMTTVALHFLIA